MFTTMYLTKMFLLLLAGPFCISVFMKRRAETMITPYICAITLLSFLLGCADRLAYSYPVFCIISILCWAAGIAGMICKKNYADVCKNFLTPGVVFFLLAATILFYGVCTLNFVCYDEYTYWGLAAKNTFQFNGYIWHFSSLLIAKTWNHYTPGLATIEYLFMRGFGAWCDGIAIWSLGVFLLGTLSIFFASFKWKNWAWLPFCFCAVFVLPLIGSYGFNFSYVSIYSDVPLAMLFAFIFLYYACFFNEKNILSWIVLFICCPVLILLKISAVLLIALFFIVALINEAIKIFRHPASSSGLPKWQKYGYYIACTAIILITFGIYKLWNSTLNHYGVEIVKESFDFTALTRWYYNAIPQLKANIFFKAVFFSGNVQLGIINISFFGFISILTAILLFIAWKTRNREQKYTFYFIAWGALTIVFFSVLQLFISYFFIKMFGYYISSQERYLYTYVLFLLAVTTGAVFLWVQKSKHTEFFAGLYVLTAFLACPVYYYICSYIFVDGEIVNHPSHYNPEIAYIILGKENMPSSTARLLYTNVRTTKPHYKLWGAGDYTERLGHYFPHLKLYDLPHYASNFKRIVRTATHDYIYISGLKTPQLDLFKERFKKEAYPYSWWKREKNGEYTLLLPSSVSFDFERVNLFDMTGKLYRHKRSIAQKHSGAVSEELDLWKKSHAALSFKKLNYSTKPLKEISMYILPKKGKFKLEVSVAGKNIITQEFSGSGGWVEVKKVFDKKTLLKDLVIRISSEDGALLYLDDVRIDFAEQPENETKK